MTRPPSDFLVLYNLVRSDLLSMRYRDGYGGKALAQSNHVGSLFSEHHIVRPFANGMMPNEDVMAWRDSENTPIAPLGFGTVLTIDVPDLITMEAVVGAADKLGFLAALQCDPSYPMIVPNEVARLMDPAVLTKPTVPAHPGHSVVFVQEFPMGYVFGWKSEVSVLLARFKLVPND
jgi:hypothetical protein